MNDIPQREADQIPEIRAPEQSHSLIGHEDVLARLVRQLHADRLPGGIMLGGPRGIGKATLAFQLAREILTHSGDEGAARVAEQVAAGVHPNLLVLRRRLREDQKAFYTVIRVDDVHEVIARLHQTRGRAGRRVVIVDALDDTNISSSNALLKILEEPPAETHFILIAHRPGNALPTIRSRCQMQAMRPLNDTEVSRIVKDQAGDAAGQLELAVSLSSGRPRRALEALAVADNTALIDLRDWLQSPSGAGDDVPLGIAEGLSGPRKQLEAGFAREIILDWIAGQALDAAQDGGAQRIRLASANALWDKANALFSDADIYNLDPRQTLMSIFDAIRSHDRLNPERLSA